MTDDVGMTDGQGMDLQRVKKSCAEWNPVLEKFFGLTRLIAEGGTSWVFEGFSREDDGWDQDVEQRYAVKVAKRPQEITNEQAQRYIGNHPDLLKAEAMAAYTVALNKTRQYFSTSGIDVTVGIDERDGVMTLPVMGCRSSRIVDLYEAKCTDEGRGYMKMELVRTWDKYPTLEALAADGMLSLSYAKRCELAYRNPTKRMYYSPAGFLPTSHHILREFFLGVKEMHDAGVLHRDLKPSNVLIYADIYEKWHIKICDLQTMVPLNERKEYFGVSHGSRYFCSPEQAYNAGVGDMAKHGTPLGPSADIYAIGCSMLCVVGKAMREQLPDVGEKRDRHDKSRFDAKMLPLLATVRPEYQDIVRKACAFRAEDRYQSVDELLQALSRSEADDER